MGYKMENRHLFVINYLKELKKTLGEMEEDMAKKIVVIADILKKARDERKTVFIMGNGGTAATASHMAGDLAKGTAIEGKKKA